MPAWTPPEAIPEIVESDAFRCSPTPPVAACYRNGDVYRRRLLSGIDLEQPCNIAEWAQTGLCLFANRWLAAWLTAKSRKRNVCALVSPFPRELDGKPP